MKPECWDLLATGLTRWEAESAAAMIDAQVYVLNEGHGFYAVGLHL